MPVLINGNSLRPAPQVVFSREPISMPDGRISGFNLVATLHGTIVPEKLNNVFVAVGIDSRLSVVLQQQQALVGFVGNGGTLDIIGWDGTTTSTMIGKLRSLEFEDGDWVNECKYTIVLEGPFISGAHSAYIESASELWTFDEAESPKLTKATHTVSAKGINKYNGDGTINTYAWQNARDFVKNKLGLGFDASGDSFWTQESGSQLASESERKPLSAIPRNHIVVENTNQVEGTYEATETFILCDAEYWEEYTVNTKKVDDSPIITEIVGISGVIHGLYDAINDFDGRYNNAVTRWQTVKDLLYSRAQATATSTLNIHPTVHDITFNSLEGTVNYTYEFNNRNLTNDTYEIYNVESSTSLEDYKTTVAISGTITGVLYMDTDNDPNIRYQRAYDQYNRIKGQFLGRAITDSGIADLQAYPVSANYSPNKSEGSISYSWSFDNRNPEKVRHEFTAGSKYSREDGRTYVSVQGTVTGLKYANAGTAFASADLGERYRNAKDYWNGISGNLLGLAANYVDTSKVNTTPYSNEVQHNEFAGSISYNYEYVSINLPCDANAISEIITVSDDASVPVYAIIPVIGRSQGPIFQNMGTIKEARRTLSIESVYAVPGSTCGTPSPPSSSNIGAYAPLGSVVVKEQDNTQWIPIFGKLYRTVTWVYLS